VVTVASVKFSQAQYEAMVASIGTRRLLADQVQAYVDAFATDACSQLSADLVYGTNCFATYSLDATNYKINIKINIEEDIAATVTDEEKAAAATSAVAAAEASTEVEATVDTADPANSGTPTAAPTPEPTLSWQSRFLFWMWLVNFWQSMW
jgi:hypothetical protein